MLVDIFNIKANPIIRDFYFIEISKCLMDLLDSQLFKFNSEELNELIKVASRTPFTMIKIKIA